MPQTVEVALPSGRTAEIHELTAREQMHADLCVQNLADIGTTLAYYRTLAALTRVGEVVFSPPTSDLDLDTRLDALTGPEYDVLRREYRLIFEQKANQYAANASVRELSAREQLEADKLSGSDPRMIGYYRVALSVERIGDREFSKIELGNKFSDELNSRIDELMGPEIDGIGTLYFEQYGLKAEELKKESSAPSSDSLPTP